MISESAIEALKDAGFHAELEIVRFALALHLDVVPDTISESDELERDLGLDPLDLVLVVLRLEELGEAEFPVADLEGLRTVGDLTALVRSWCDAIEIELDRDRDRITLPAPEPKASGFHHLIARPAADRKIA